MRSARPALDDQRPHAGPAPTPLGLYWAKYAHDMPTAEVLHFLQALRRHLPPGFGLIWDRHCPHWAMRVQTWLALHRRIVAEWLPLYAPDLNPRCGFRGNPVEHVWGHINYGDQANFTPDNLPALEHAVLTCLAHTRARRHALAAFFR